MIKINDSLTKLLINPISSEHTAGINVCYDDEYEFIEDELAKQGSMIDRGPVDWEKVSQACINILSSKSKDLKVSCYLTRALFEEQGVSGIKTGLMINYQILVTYWDNLFPIKARARSNAYEWLSDKFEIILSEHVPDISQLDELDEIYQIIQKIEQLLNARLKKKAPALGNFRRLILALIEPLKELQKIEDERVYEHKTIQNVEDDRIIENEKNQSSILTTESSEHTTEIVVEKNLIETDTTSSVKKEILSKTEKGKLNHITDLNSTSINLSPINNEKDKKKIIHQCHEAMRNLSLWSLRENLDSPSAYAMNRFSTWMGITQLPMHKNNVTPLRSLPNDKINYYNNLFESKNYRELIPQVEQSFSKAPFWLDAHYLVAVSLEALGMHKSAIQVKDHLALFLRQYPDLSVLKFMDNIGFADETTKQWINAEVLANNPDLTIQSSGADPEMDYESVINEAGLLLKVQKMNEAIALFQDKIEVQSNLRKKTFWKYYLAKFCYDNAQNKLAFFLLKEIDGIFLKNKLEYWEPDLEKNIVYLLIRTYRNRSQAENLEEISNTDNFEKEISQLYSRLCQLDPILALDV